MSSIWNQLIRPLSYRGINGEFRYLSSQNIYRVKNYVLGTLSALALKVYFSSRSLKSNVLSVGFRSAGVFYIAIAFFRMRNKDEITPSKNNRDFSDPSKAHSVSESVRRVNRECDLNALGRDLLAFDKPESRQDVLRQIQWPSTQVKIEDQKRDDQL